MLLGYAYAFSQNASESVDRWSMQLLVYLKGAFLICLLCISFYIVLSEGVSPFLKARQNEVLTRTNDYNDFIMVANKSISLGLMSEAEYQANCAVQIWPESKPATELLEKIRYEIAKSTGDESARSKKEALSTAVNHSPGSSALTVREALDMAEGAEKNLDFYSAHYFAMLAYNLAPDTEPLKSKAMSIASNAWNYISTGIDALKAADEILLYKTKLSGYEAIQNKDYLKAYYIFLTLHEKEIRTPDGRIDPDVDRFLDVSRKGVLDSYFFIDETLNVRLFETARDIFFVIKDLDGSFSSIFIRGVSYTKASGKDMMYLRGFEYARFDQNKKIEYQIYVPYGKMFPYTTDKGLKNPEIFLRSVNRTIEGADILPVVISGKVPEIEKSILRLNMSFSDFNLIVAANNGAASLSLIELIKFCDLAEKYGFSRTQYQIEMIDRLADPFLMLIVSIYALILGWKYRLGKNVLFKAWWILVVPLFPIISLFLIETIRYISKLCIVLFVRFFPQNPALFMLIFLAIWFAGASFYFFSQRSD